MRRALPSRDLHGLVTVGLLAAGVLASGPVAHAQSPPRDWATDAEGEVTLTAVNAVLGGLTAGIYQALRGGAFEDGFTRGALGGSVVYAGKRLSAARFSGAGFLGRQVAATGSSIVHNAGRGEPMLETLYFPIGPLHFYVTPGRPSPVRLKVDAYDVSWIVYGLAERRLELDVGESFSSGAPVFRSPRSVLVVDGDPVLGETAGGIILLSAGLGAGDGATLAHERTHVIQHDFIFRAWTSPAEDWAAERLPARTVTRWVDFGVAWPTLVWTTSPVLGDALSDPLEVEAEFLEER